MISRLFAEPYLVTSVVIVLSGVIPLYPLSLGFTCWPRDFIRGCMLQSCPSHERTADPPDRYRANATDFICSFIAIGFSNQCKLLQVKSELGSRPQLPSGRLLPRTLTYTFFNTWS